MLTNNIFPVTRIITIIQAEKYILTVCSALEDSKIVIKCEVVDSVTRRKVQAFDQPMVTVSLNISDRIETDRHGTVDCQPIVSKRCCDSKDKTGY